MFEDYFVQVTYNFFAQFIMHFFNRIFMKLCTFLKSRMESVRRATRETLQKIMITLGPKYLHYLLKELNTLLTKGFQVHVLAYTVQAVLVALKPYYQKMDINNNLQSILSVSIIFEIFDRINFANIFY